MLYQNPYNSEEPNPSLGETRVKREELARAIAALEARRQEEIQHREGTVNIEETLRELQMDVSAEEVLEQIEKQRRGEVKEEKPLRQVRDPEKWTETKLVGGIIFVPLVMLALFALFFNPFRPIQPTVTVPTTNAPFQNQSSNIVSQMMSSPTMRASGVEMSSYGFNASSVLRPLGEVPDNQAVHCNTKSVADLLAVGPSLDDAQVKPHPSVLYPFPPRGFDPIFLANSKQFFDVRPNLQKPWALIKHDGRLYLRGWVSARLTEADIKNQPLTLQTSSKGFAPNSNPVSITIPISFSVVAIMPNFPPASEDRPAIKVIHAHLDSHAWEKW